MREAVMYVLSLVFVGAAAIALARVPSLPIAAGQPEQGANRGGQLTTTPSPNLPTRDSGNARRVHQSGPHARAA
jgi:hypothetical protein